MFNIVTWGIYIFLFIYVVTSATEKLTGVEEITVYQQYCVGELNGDILSCEENGHIPSISKNRFRIDFKNQRVVSTDDIYIENHCNVFDKENWYCVSANNRWMSMRNGDYTASYFSETINGQTITHFRTVPVTWYWYQSVRYFFGIS